jgi:sugar phosphate isomerase/epimerase
MDQVLIATDYQQLAGFRRWAEALGLGLELQAFADPAVLANDWVAVLDEHQRLLTGFKGHLGLHGAFYDMVSASLDPAIVDVTRIRYRQNLHAAAVLEADYIVFHVNYMGFLKFPDYRPGWHRRQVAFWQPYAEEAARLGIYILLENLWEDDPTLITEILTAVNNPYLKACLDISHATLFSRDPIEHWLTVFTPHLHLCHLNNHDGQQDLHWPLNRGVIDYPHIMELLRRLPAAPLFTLEMPHLEWMKSSLDYFQLSPSAA